MDTTETTPESVKETTSGSVDRFDVLRYHDDTHRAVPAGDGQRVVTAHETEARQRRLMGSLTVGLVAVVTATVFGLRYSADTLVLAGGGVILGATAGIVRYLYRDYQRLIPEVVASDVSSQVVDSYIDDFDPNDVSDPFDGTETK